MSTEVTKQEQNDVATVERTRGGLTYSPRIDIWESDNELVLYADLPGVAPEDLDIQFENRELRIHGKVAARHESCNFVGGEYGIGDFYRTFTIGEAVDAEKISAELDNGVLALHLPKTEAVRPRRIEVKGMHSAGDSSAAQARPAKRGNGKSEAPTTARSRA
jgi:HSP20 family molecular chaperone IbpA